MSSITNSVDKTNKLSNSKPFLNSDQKMAVGFGVIAVALAVVAIVAGVKLGVDSKLFLGGSGVGVGSMALSGLFHRFGKRKETEEDAVTKRLARKVLFEPGKSEEL